MPQGAQVPSTFQTTTLGICLLSRIIIWLLDLQLHSIREEKVQQRVEASMSVSFWRAFPKVLPGNFCLYLLATTSCKGGCGDIVFDLGHTATINKILFLLCLPLLLQHCLPNFALTPSPFGKVLLTFFTLFFSLQDQNQVPY